MAMANLRPEIHSPPLQKLDVKGDPHEFLLQVYEYAKTRFLEIKPAADAGVCSIEEAREACGWISLVQAIQEFDS